MGRYNDGLIVSVGGDDELFYEMVEEQHERQEKPEPWIGSGTREAAAQMEAMTSNEYDEWGGFEGFQKWLARKRRDEWLAQLRAERNS